MEFGGNIDVFGHCSTLGGFLGIGWVESNWSDTSEGRIAVALGDAGAATGEIYLSMFPREDVRKRGYGITFFFRCNTDKIGSIVNMVISEKSDTFKLIRSLNCRELSEWQIIDHFKNASGATFPSAIRTDLRSILHKPTYKGEDTLPHVSVSVNLGIDRLYFCPPRSFVIVGWFLDPFDEVAAIRVRWGASACLLDPSKWVTIRRPDVSEAFASKFPISHERLGFAAFVRDVHQSRGAPYLEFEMVDGRVAVYCMGFASRPYHCLRKRSTQR